MKKYLISALISIALCPPGAAMASTWSSFFGSAINTIQYGTVSITAPSFSGSATITTVVVAKTMIVNLGCSGSNGTPTSVGAMTLTNSTTVSVTIPSGASISTDCRFVAVQYN